MEIQKIGKLTALFSFIVGTILLLIYYQTMSVEFAVFSYFLLMVIGVINLAILVILIFRYYRNSINKKEELKTIGILLLNIPVVVFYFYIVVILTSLIRLTITNKTNTDLENISISGCEEKKIKLLKQNESETIWIKIPNDCSIDMIYKLNNFTKKENIFGYVTNMMGQKVEYRLGIDNKPIDTEF